MADELDLNSLSRYRKVSKKLLLEVHGHCEVPAGCGGVVLRWSNPAEDGSEAVLVTYTPGELKEVTIDGEVITESRPTIKAGRHCLCLELSGLVKDTGALLLALTNQNSDLFKPQARGGMVKVHLVSEVGCWRYSAKEPEGDGWRLPGFDDSGWLYLVNKEAPEPQDYGRGRWAHGQATKAGGKALGSVADKECLWVRVEFDAEHCEKGSQ